MARTDGAGDDEAPANTELQRSEADEPIKLSLAATSAAAAAAAAAAGDGKAAAAAAARSRPAPLFGDDDGEWLRLDVELVGCWAVCSWVADQR
jgi:hypothetical protein